MPIYFSYYKVFVFALLVCLIFSLLILPFRAFFWENKNSHHINFIFVILRVIYYQAQPVSSTSTFNRPSEQHTVILFENERPQ